MGAREGISEVLEMSPHYLAEYGVMWTSEMCRQYPDLGDTVYDLMRRFVALREGEPPAQNGCSNRS